MRSFAQTVWLGEPGDVVVIRLDGEDFRLIAPETMRLLDIAANYAWQHLLPEALIEPDRERLLEWLHDPDHPASWKRLHVVVQPLGTYFYGFPFFTAARALGTLMHYYTAFQMWAVTNVTVDLARATAVQWCAAAVSWQLHLGEKDTDRKDTWARLTVPGRLPFDAPGVTPHWIS